MSREVLATRVERLRAARTRLLERLAARLPTRADAEDVLQTAWLQVVAKGHTLRDDERLVPWFERIVHNALVDHQRRRQARERAARRAATETPGVTDPGRAATP